MYANEDNPFYQHMPPAEALPLFRSFGWPYGEYFKFTFVRNPWARLVSLYEHIRRSNNAPDVGPFEQWLRTIRPDGHGGGGSDAPPWQRYGAWSIESFIKDVEGRVLVDKVFRLEDVDTELMPALRRQGIPVGQGTQIGHKNRRPSGGRYQSYYSRESAEYVAELYRYDVKNFRYRFKEDALAKTSGTTG